MSVRRQAIDQAVAGIIAGDSKKRAANGASDLCKVNVRLPVDLVDEIKGEAHRLTGHKRRGFSDLLALLLRHGWDAYQAGELELETKPARVELRIVKAQK